MQLALAPTEYSVSASPATDSRLYWRFGCFFVLLFLEILAISSQAQHFAFSGAQGLAGLLFTLGPWKIRAPITLTVLFLLFWQAKGRQNMQRVLACPAGPGIAWPWLAAHAAVFASFAWVSLNLVNHPPQGQRLNALILVSLALGLAAVVSCAFSFVRPAIWREIFRGTGEAWVYLLALVAGACVAAFYAERIWEPLARWTLILANAILRPFVPGLMMDPAARTLGFRDFTVAVAPGCSGYEGIGLILVFTTAYLWFMRREWRFPRALLLIPAGVAAIWLSNALRIAGLVVMGATVSPDVAMKGFHSHAGWILFNVVALGICMAARRISWLTAEGGTATLEPVVAEPRTESAEAAYLTPFLGILAAGMLVGAVSGGFEWLYPLRIAAAAVAIWYFRRTYRSLDWRAGWPALGAGAAVFVLWIGFERLTGANAAAGMPLQLAQAAPLARMSWIALRILGAVVTVPIAEELAFRGYLFRRLASSNFEAVAFQAFRWLPFMVSSVAFGLLHGDRWLVATIAGMIYALVLVRRGRIGEAVIAHATTNALLAAWVLTTGQWQLW